ncbi:2-succinyl-5-enolpyruvyl-6-hydroxy-3-cyclohexene-1-carboxylic-acid synthase [Filibacter tadaridae]|uniref:2-succinyl-5-enolpyruvyl-6-hydroxy-3-cyclohexene-1-carboxylate synthase n=1 Tax=Filibacter tadaridae TaxID=2483811 RepID=A0A3P5WUV6_9BACL|nr:2-succinyl-5-enolpyruvyl-6-hydroxy-3-cyclohexene-1-carboxylic-acid synthase [Filibacter tadaridae]VDC25545.1 2-succinyl-5-enolpyruvyl-6-hydroxy-3-cyclohexene-1-carboxylate synthase [Filibacter tadaridae]
MDDQAVLTDYVRRFTATLMNAGVKAAVVSPGSRSTPLAYAFASTEKLDVYMQTDERSAAFFALGLAKASGEPVALLCTSGTAASNYHPAITEARYARIPLVVITADRPHELREVGAPQAIDQIRMYGNHVKYSVDLPLAEGTATFANFIDRQVSRALSVATTAPNGPVHLNVPFREPLLIDFDKATPTTTFIKRFTAVSTLNHSTAQLITDLLSDAGNGFIIAGEMPVGLNKEAFWKFAKALNWPVLCDPLSNLRSEVPDSCSSLCIDQYDAILKSEQFANKIHPQTVIRFGAQPVSKPLTLFLMKVCPQTMIAVDESPEFRDSIGVVTHHVQAPVEAVLSLNVQKPLSSYTQQWCAANDRASTIMDTYTGDVGGEGIFAKLLFEHLQDGGDLVSGSSMPIRDVDTFFRKTGRNVTIFANRGANGIDGVVSTAFGIQFARKRPTWLLIGDLSFLHDINGFIVSRFHKTDLTIIIMNNDGGGIFSHLSQAQTNLHFEQLFGTPTGLTFEHIAAMYDAQYAKVNTPNQFSEELGREKNKPIRIIEVFTDRQVNVKAHRNLWAQITESLDQIE